MESSKDDESDYFSSVIDNLVNMFGHILTKEVITTLVESFDGDLNQCVDAIAEITNDGNSIPTEDIQPPARQDTNPNTMVQQTQLNSNSPSISYARTSQSTGAIHRQPRTFVSPQYFWTDQIRNIMTHHNNGSRVMIFLRGLPGSGKTHLSRLLVESLVGPSFANHKNHIFSSDDYFVIRGQYHYDKSNLSYAHSWNQNRVKEAACKGLSPIIVDNTNIEIWEMRPYLIDGVNNGYIIEIVEPMTPWAKKATQLYNRNIHNVPLRKIKLMLDKYVDNVTVGDLMRSFRLNYSANMTPPINRLIPPIPTENLNTRISNVTVSSQSKVTSEFGSHLFQSSIQSNKQKHIQAQTVDSASYQNNIETLSNNSVDIVKGVSEVNDLAAEEQAKQNIVLEAQKRLEELQKFEEEWENGEKWEEAKADDVTNVVGFSKDSVISSSIITSSTITSSTATTSSFKHIPVSFIPDLESKPPRKKPAEDFQSDTIDKPLMQYVTDHEDWRNISLFMSPWNSDEQKELVPAQNIPVEKKNISTCVEMHDFNLSGNRKIITATSRDINELYIPPEREKIPERRMLDKGTMTSDGKIMILHCPQKERHFIAFRNLFKHIERDSLRYIFDNCCGDANWAVENILGGEVEYNLKNTGGVEESDSEEIPDVEIDSPCTCLEKYEIIPNVSKLDDLPLVPADELSEQSAEVSVPQLEKKKRVNMVSEENMQLKRQIEQNVVISDSHYSDHCLKIRKIKRGEYNKVDDITEQPSTSGTSEIVSVLESSNPSAPNIDSTDDEDGSSSSTSESDKIVNINLGSFFIKELDVMFGRKDMEYPDNINYNISVPISILNEINALWIESMMFQLEKIAERSAAMVKQDEEFARQLQLKEQELQNAGKEPEIPDFREIMDLEFALNLHMKDISEWRNSIPQDLAAKMTHEKLCNLFPEIQRDTLLEVLYACNNNFETTVESLLISLGREDILETENGVNKFIMEKELQRQGKLLAEQKKALSEAEVPHLKKGMKVDMSTVQLYRDNAERHLNRRNINMQKAEDYIRRGMIPVANYFSDVANFHKSQYEHANSMAVATLMLYHSENNPNGETVDLHFLRVKEAKETMDLFIDDHIQKLRSTNKRSIMLFFITGRGLHSPGRPKVKPACIKRLRERGLRHSECNPGLLRSRITCDTKLTYQIP